ncbi:hypothetical protein IBX65_02520 [Candidatus Aerophobetes bacterium]|nr:hypothetical protein [Candidatus Aerophobetes bacterium]
MNHKQNLTPRERVLTTLKHKEPDYIPYDLGSTSVTGIHSVTYNNLLHYLGKDYLLKNRQQSSHYETLQGLAKIDEAMKRALKVDTRASSFKNSSAWKLEIKEMEGNKAFTDELGCIWISPKDGYYFDQVPGKSHPLANIAKIEDINNYNWPEPKDAARITNLRAELKKR